MNRIVKVIIVLLFGAPVAVALTIVALPLWRWFEATTGIESIGHSGPAVWCFVFMYALCVALGILLLAKDNDQNAKQ